MDKKKTLHVSFKDLCCDAYVHIPKEKRSKLDMKSQKCILVRYGDNVKVYRLYNPSSKTIIISMDVIFHEKSQLQNIKERESTNIGQLTSIRIKNTKINKEQSDYI
jgi:hypothetical protein